MPTPESHSSVLGRLTFFEEDELWWSKTEIAGTKILFWIGGGLEPNSELVRSAETIVKTPLPFMEMVLDGVRKVSPNSRHLAVREIGCWSPENPESVQVYVANNDGSEVWRCEVDSGLFVSAEREDGPLIDPER